MVISLKKLVCLFLLLVCAVSFILSTCSAYSSLSTIAEASENKVTVVIDAGHGGGY